MLLDDTIGALASLLLAADIAVPSGGACESAASLALDGIRYDLGQRLLKCPGESE